MRRRPRLLGGRFRDRTQRHPGHAELDLIEVVRGEPLFAQDQSSVDGRVGEVIWVRLPWRDVMPRVG